MYSLHPHPPPSLHYTVPVINVTFNNLYKAEKAMVPIMVIPH